MTVADGYFRAFVQRTPEEAYFVQTVDDIKGRSVVTVMHEDPETHAAYCGTTSEHHTVAVPGRGKSSHAYDLIHGVLAPYETEIAFVVDRLGYAQYETLEELELELLTILNYTDAYYTLHQLTYRLTEIFVIEELDSQPWEESSSAGTLLENFTAWARNTSVLQHHDVVTLWSGIDFGSTIGIAWLGTIGSSHRQNVVNFPKGRERRNSNVHAHELGHNWGSGHVSSGGWMMSASLSGANSEAQWHNSTIDAFPGYVADAMEHLVDVGDGGGSAVLNVNFSDLTVTGDENGSGLLDPGETGQVNLTIENLDVDPIAALQVTMASDNNRAINFATVQEEPVMVESVDANGAATVAFEVTLALEAPGDRNYRFLFKLTDGTRAAENTLILRSGDQQLPVELTSFTALESEEGVVLAWETAMELNNAGFDVEVQAGGEAFQRVAFVEGAGTTSGSAAVPVPAGISRAGNVRVQTQAGGLRRHVYL